MPLKLTEFLKRPWQRGALDLFYQRGEWWLLVTDYFPRYPEIAYLENTTTQVVGAHCTSFVAWHGISEVFVSDNRHNFHEFQPRKFPSLLKNVGSSMLPGAPIYTRQRTGGGCSKNNKILHGQYKGPLRVPALVSNYKLAEKIQLICAAYRTPIAVKNCPEKTCQTSHLRRSAAQNIWRRLSTQAAVGLPWTPRWP